ncbi:MAG: hypothetical protein K2Y37_13030 [Pirellulales bacterium]|nr:hypothetical protein [Pirellulales bacterium]
MVLRLLGTFTFRTGHRLLPAIAVVVVALLGSFLSAADAKHDRHQAAREAVELVRQLGDDSFEVRQRATLRLARIGLPAKAALLAGLQVDDPEVRMRCRRVLAIVLDLDLKSRIEAFAADRDGREDHDLPGWDRYRQLVGSDATTRELFVEMQRAEADLLEAQAAAPDQVSPLMQARCEQLQQRAYGGNQAQRGQISLGSVAALFFVATHPDVTVSDQMISYLHTFSYQQSVQGAMRDAALAAPIRKLIGAWIAKPSGSPNAYQNFMLALQFDLREGLAPALAMLRDGGVQPHIAQYALLLIAKFGGRADLTAVAPFLADENLLGSLSINNKEVRTELRDVALAVAVHITGQDFATYGFEHLQKNPQMVFQPMTTGFGTPAKRAAAFKKWNEWLAAQPKDAAPAEVGPAAEAAPAPAAPAVPAPKAPSR